MLEPFNS